LYGGGVTIPLHRAHGLVWLPTSGIPHVFASPAMVRPCDPPIYLASAAWSFGGVM
jgi:hypothetical protein